MALFRQVLRPAQGVPRRVGGRQEQPRLSGLGRQGRRLLPHGQPPAPERQPQEGEHVLSVHVPPPSSASMASYTSGGMAVSKARSRARDFRAFFRHAGSGHT